MKHEAKYNTLFNHWLKNVYKQTMAYEMKQTQGNSLPFSDVQDHQIAALEAANHGTLVYKIPDVGYQNPFDGICLSGVPAYVVVKFKDSFELIAIDTFTLERKRSTRKSLTYERAKAISTMSIDL